MAPSLLYVLSFGALAAAQSSTTVSLFLPNADPQSLVGSVAGSDATATTYVIGCANAASSTAAAAPSGGNLSDIGQGCGFDVSQTITQGPSTYHYVFTEPNFSAALTVDCVLSGTTQAVCAETASGSALTAAPDSSLSLAGTNAGIPPVTTATLSASDFPPYQQVVITAGLSNLKAAGASSTGSAGSAGKTSASGSGSATSGGSSTASSTGATAKGSSGAAVRDPALAAGAAGAVALGLVAFAL